MPSKIDHIRASLETLQPAHLALTDESHMHSRGQESHYKAIIVSEAFIGQRPLQRHQLVYRALGALMSDFHALALHTYTPDEWADTGHVPDSPRCRGGSKYDHAAAT